MKLSYSNIRTTLHVKVKITEFTFLEREGEEYYSLSIWRSSLRPQDQIIPGN